VAARRLVVVMLVLLGVSTLAAAFLPPPDEPNSTDRERQQAKAKQREPKPAPRRSENGMLLVARLQVSQRRPTAVRIERGDELRLTVIAPFGDDVEIPGFGLTSPVTPYAPAQFDLLATETGNFGVLLVDSGRLAGRILVGKPGSGRCGVSTPVTPQGRASAPPCSPLGRRESRGRGRSARQP
jgi:hypothetical protein